MSCAWHCCTCVWCIVCVRCFRFEYDIDSMLDMVLYPVSQMHYHARRSVNWNNCALVNALVCLGTGALQNEAVCHVLQLLSWNNITLSEGILVMFLEEVHVSVRQEHIQGRLHIYQHMHVMGY